VPRRKPATAGVIYRDGQYVEVKTKAEVSRWIHQTYLVADAVRTLATMEANPDEQVRGLTEDIRQDLARDLPHAIARLIALHRALTQDDLGGPYDTLPGLRPTDF
jgi:hypothetical protein